MVGKHEGETEIGHNSERKQDFLKHTKAYTERSKRTGRKASFLAVFLDIIRREALPEEAEITVKRIAMREIKKKRGHEVSNIYRLAEFNAGN